MASAGEGDIRARARLLDGSDLLVAFVLHMCAILVG